MFSSHQQPKIHVNSKYRKVIVIRGTKDRPPQRGSLKRGVTAGIEKSLTNNGGKAVDCWSEEAVGKKKRERKTQKIKSKKYKSIKKNKRLSFGVKTEKRKNEFHCELDGEV